jgi:hypothetical protein
MRRVQPHPPIERAELGRSGRHDARLQNFLHDILAFPRQTVPIPERPVKAAETLDGGFRDGPPQLHRVLPAESSRR